MHDRVTIQHWGGQIEDVPVDVARRLVASGHAWLLSALPDAEATTIEPSERAILPRPKRRRRAERR